MSSAAIPYGAAGVVVTTEKGKERHAVRDTIRNLNDTYEELFPSDEAAGRAGDEKKSSSDVSDLLAAELSELKEEAKGGGSEAAQRFKCLDLDFKACMFITMNWEAATKCPPSELVHKMLVKTRDEGQPRSRFALRIVPVDTVCFAGIEEIKKAMAPLVEKHFGGVSGGEGGAAKEGEKSGGEAAGKEGKTFAIMFASRANNSLKRKDVIEAVASLVPAPHKVNLTTPDLTIMCEVIKGTCCVSVVRDYFPLMKYNQRLLSMTDEERDAEKGRTENFPKGTPEIKPVVEEKDAGGE